MLKALDHGSLEIMYDTTHKQSTYIYCLEIRLPASQATHIAAQISRRAPSWHVSSLFNHVPRPCVEKDKWHRLFTDVPIESRPDSGTTLINKHPCKPALSEVCGTSLIIQSTENLVVIP